MSIELDEMNVRLMTWGFGDFIQLLCVCGTNLVLLHGLLCDVVQVSAKAGRRPQNADLPRRGVAGPPLGIRLLGRGNREKLGEGDDPR